MTTHFEPLHRDIPLEAAEILNACPGYTVARKIDDLVALAVRDAPAGGWHANVTPMNAGHSHARESGKTKPNCFCALRNRGGQLEVDIFVHHFALVHLAGAPRFEKLDHALNQALGRRCA